MAVRMRTHLLSSAGDVTHMVMERTGHWRTPKMASSASPPR